MKHDHIINARGTYTPLGVSRSSREAYDEAVGMLFSALDHLDNLLAGQRYLAGRQISEADWRLFTTLIRFDTVYFTHFKTNRRRIADYHHLGPYLRELYQVPGVADTVDMNDIRRHYYLSHKDLNPFGIIPIGPELDLDRSSGRENVGFSSERFAL